MHAIGMALVVLVVSPSAAADFTSGPQIGATVPGQFEPLNLTGPDAGDECCLYCKFGNAPVVMIFTPKATAELGRMVRAVEKTAAGQKGEFGACVVVTDTSPATRKALAKLADDANLKHVVLSVIDPTKVKDYELNAAAGMTVLLYSKKVVRENFAFRPGEVTDTVVSRVAAAVKTHLSGRN